MKTLDRSRKTLLIGSLLLGAFLLVSPAMAFAQTGGSTSYTNYSGENATVNVTDNQPGSNFTIQAAGSCLSITYVPAPTATDPQATKMVAIGCVGIPFVSTLALNEHQTLYVYSVGAGIIGSPGQGIFTEYPVGTCAYGSTCSPQSQAGYYYPGGTFLQPIAGKYGYSGYGAETLYSYLASLHSIYMFTGTGSHDRVTITGGLTEDIYSVTAPGAHDIVNINAGSGNSSYSIILGLSGTININPQIGAATYNYYNIVYAPY